MLVMIFPVIGVVDTIPAPTKPPTNMSLASLRQFKPEQAMLPHIEVNVPMPRIKDDPRFVGIPEIDSEEAAMIRAWINSEAENKLETFFAEAQRVFWQCAFGAGFVFLLTSVLLWFFASPLYLLTLSGLSYPLQRLRHMKRLHEQRKKFVEQEKKERLAEYGLCPPIPR